MFLIITARKHVAGKTNTWVASHMCVAHVSVCCSRKLPVKNNVQVVYTHAHTHTRLTVKAI
jgi:hypothetical protein